MASEILAALIRRKRTCLEQLHQLGQKQRALIDQDQITALLDLLTIKQRMLFELRKVDVALRPFAQQSPQERQWNDPEQRRQCAADVAECERLLAEIVTRQKEDEATLVRRRDEVSNALQGLHVASQARSAYESKPVALVNRLDLSSDVEEH